MELEGILLVGLGDGRAGLWEAAVPFADAQVVNGHSGIGSGIELQHVAFAGEPGAVHPLAHEAFVDEQRDGGGATVHADGDVRLARGAPSGIAAAEAGVLQIAFAGACVTVKIARAAGEAQEVGVLVTDAVEAIGAEHHVQRNVTFPFEVEIHAGHWRPFEFLADDVAGAFADERAVVKFPMQRAEGNLGLHNFIFAAQQREV